MKVVLPPFLKIVFFYLIIVVATLFPSVVFAHHISSSASTWTLNESSARVDFQYPLADIVILVAPDNVRKQETYIQIIKPVDDALRAEITGYLQKEIPSKILLNGCKYSGPLDIRYQETKIIVHGELACEKGYLERLKLEDIFLVAVNRLHVSLATLDVGNDRLKCLFRSGLTGCSPCREGQPCASSGVIPWKAVMGRGEALVFHGFEQWLFFILLIIAATDSRSFFKLIGAFLAGNVVGLLPLLMGQLPEPSLHKPLMPMFLAYGALSLISGKSGWKRWTWWVYFLAHSFLFLLCIAGVFLVPPPAMIGMALLGYGIISQAKSDVSGATTGGRPYMRSMYIFSALFGLEHGFVLADGLRNYNTLGAGGLLAILGFDFSFGEKWRYVAMAVALSLVAVSRSKVKFSWWTQALSGGIAVIAVFWVISRGINLPEMSFNYKESAEALKNIIQNPDFGPQLLVISLILAVILGALHALTPGHGKTVVAAYLVGSKGRVIDALILGVIVTVTHTSSVLLLGVIALLAQEKILPGDLTPYLGALSGAIIVIMGAIMLATRLRNWRSAGSAIPEHNTLHTHNHDYDHEHEAPEVGVRLFDLIALGISGGMVPCPDAFVVLLIAIAGGRLVLGIVVILAFSLGLAAVLITIGILMVKARPLVERLGLGGIFIRVYMPLASALLVTLIGAAITYQFISRL